MMVRDSETAKIFEDDAAFNKLFFPRIQAKAQRHWTPLEVAKAAAEFLAPEDNVHVLDIGSGVGKFCLAAARHKPNGLFYGVEQRKALVDQANDCSNRLDLFNVFFIHGNFTQLDFRQFDHFYFFNSFYENLAGTEKIDFTIAHSPSLYDYYNRYLYRQLEDRKPGTRIATYHSSLEELPPGYYEVNSSFNGWLKFWVKV
jgi:SAM-dependent methyltransferase